jgi:threonine/homoserine/homoserine lactone efflux protein
VGPGSLGPTPGLKDFHDSAPSEVKVPSIVEGIILGLSVAAPIGPTNIELIRRGLKGGFWVCIFFAAGVETALIAYLIAIFAGLSFLTEVEWVNVILSVFGVVVLFYLGYVSLKDFVGRHNLDLDSKTQGDRHFVSGILLTITNPAVLLFWSGIIGANIATKAFTLKNSILISGGILIGVAIWLVFLSALLHGGRKYVTPRVFGYISAIAGLVLIAFGLSFGYRLLLKFV